MRNMWRRAVGFLLSIGEYPHETEAKRTKRRIFVVADTIATILTIPVALDSSASGYTLVAVAQWTVLAATPVAFLILTLRPLWFPWVVNGVSQR